MSRLPDWEARLDAYLRETEETPFRWGQHDCAMAACDAVEAITGRNPGAQFRATYGNVIDSVDVVRTFGTPSFEDMVAELAEGYGFVEVIVPRARRGDLVLLDAEYGPTLGVVDLTGENAVFPSSEGRQRRRVLYCRRAWQVG